ncbi:MAG: redoxin domain-containing protein [Chloroflexi bacterium]|nr:redoxin domain-containing protein [Chloroflexota bacterium]
MSGDVTLGLAFVAGIISFISPCVLPLVPAYIGYMGGQLTQQITPGGDQPSRTFRQRFHTFTHGIFFVLGFTLFFVAFGLLTTAAVSSLESFGVSETDLTDGIARVGGTAVILFGLHIMGILNRVLTWLMNQVTKLDKTQYGNIISLAVTLALLGVTYWLMIESWFMVLVMVLLFILLFRDAFKADTSGEFWMRVLVRIQTALYVDTRRQSQAQNQQRYGYFGSLFMGVVFSAGWTPCIGPIYAAVLTLAATGDSVGQAGTLLTAYSLGLGIPFLLTALALDQAQGVFRRLQRNMRTIEVFSGVFLIAIGVLVFSGQMERLSEIGGADDTSLTLEHCVAGVYEGDVLFKWDNFRECMDEGLKDDFFVSNTKVATARNIDVPYVALSEGKQLDLTETLAGLSVEPIPTARALAPLPTYDEYFVANSVAPDADSTEAEDTVSAGPSGLESEGDAVESDGTLSATALDVTPLDAAPLDTQSPDSPGIASNDLGSELETGYVLPPEVARLSVGLETGQRAPDFTVETLDGQTVSLSDFRGKVVLVNFWATWCEPCRSEMPDFQRFYSNVDQERFTILAVNYRDGRGDVQDFADEFELTFPILLDESGEINDDQYQVSGYPESFLLDADGVIIQHFLGEISAADISEALESLEQG